MLNICTFKDKEILINAPGNGNVNRIKNDLIWDINTLLNTRYNLYAVFVSKTCVDAAYHFPISSVFQKYAVFQNLDPIFTNRIVLNDNEIEYYRKTMDPLEKMNYDVFKEACCLENVDIEYIAMENPDRELPSNLSFKSVREFNRWVVSSFPVYISLFGAKEVRIIINDSFLWRQLQKIVLKHCVLKY